MDEMLSMSLWIMIAFMTISAGIVWFNAQPGINQYNLGMQGYTNNQFNVDSNKYINIACTMTTLVDLPGYAICFINKLISPLGDMIGYIWNLLTAWTQLLHAIFVSVPAGNLFEAIITPLLTIIEIGAAIILLMRFAAIIRGVAGGFL
jgi:hypothetical protein